MDIVDSAIAKKYHEIRGARFFNETWEQFDTAATGKKLFLFGVGVGADYYYYKYGDRAKAEGIIDNNPLFQGCLAQMFLWEKLDQAHRALRVSDISVVDEFESDELVVLITSFKHYQNIALELKAHRVNRVFSLLCMEARYRILKQGPLLSSVTGYSFLDKPYYFQKSYGMPICQNKILLYTECEWAGHGKEIVKQLLNIRSDLDIVWLVNEVDSPVPSNVRIVLKRNYAAFIYEWASARIWLADTLIDFDVKKREGQEYIQIKHWSSITLKKFGYDFAKSHNNDAARIKICDKNRDMMDCLFVGSVFDEKTCRRGLGFSGKVIKVGSPRSDALFQPESSNLRKQYSVSKEKKILLYAPTFRLYSKDWDELTVFCDLNFDLAKRSLEERFGGEWVIFLRLHPVAASHSKKIKIPDYVIDVSGYYDGEELVVVSDVMITDYSSIMFEPAYMKKPVFLLATDLQKYLEEERGFLIDYNTLPFPIAESNEELALNIKYFDNDIYEKNIDCFMAQYGVHEDGHAGERAARFISDLIDGKRS